MRFVLLIFQLYYPEIFFVFQGSYLAHTQGKKHQANLARRAAQQAAEQPALPFQEQKLKASVKKFVKIGRPGYKGFAIFTYVTICIFFSHHIDNQLLF